MTATCVRCGVLIQYKELSDQAHYWLDSTGGEGCTDDEGREGNHYPVIHAMTEAEFFSLWVEVSMEVADQFYPKILPLGPNPGRGEYLRDQGVLYSRIVDELTRRGILRP